MSPISDQIGGVMLQEWIIMPLFLLYEFKILSSNFSLAWLYNLSAIS